MWREHLVFRDALRADEDLRARYQELKLRLASEFADDKAAYTKAKGPFIQAALELDARALAPAQVGPARLMAHTLRSMS